jgi:hypothetical protein
MDDQQVHDDLQGILFLPDIERLGSYEAIASKLEAIQSDIDNFVLPFHEQYTNDRAAWSLTYATENEFKESTTSLLAMSNEAKKRRDMKQEAFSRLKTLSEAHGDNWYGIVPPEIKVPAAGLVRAATRYAEECVKKSIGFQQAVHTINHNIHIRLTRSGAGGIRQKQVAPSDYNKARIMVQAQILNQLNTIAVLTEAQLKEMDMSYMSSGFLGVANGFVFVGDVPIHSKPPQPLITEHGGDYKTTAAQFNFVNKRPRSATPEQDHDNNKLPISKAATCAMPRRRIEVLNYAEEVNDETAKTQEDSAVG